MTGRRRGRAGRAALLVFPILATAIAVTRCHRGSAPAGPSVAGTRGGPPPAFRALRSWRMSNDFHVHWGEVRAREGLWITTRPSLTGWPQNHIVRYPLKRAGEGVFPWDASPGPSGEEDYESGLGLGPRPALDADYYRSRARETRGPPVRAVARPAGSGLYSSRDNPGGVVFEGVEWREPGAVLFVEAGAREKFATGVDNAFLDVEALVLWGGRHDGWVCDGAAVFEATVPAGAAAHYRHPEARSVWTMTNPPPAVGGPSFASVGEGRCCYPVRGAALHGFYYVGGRLLGTGCGPSAVVGGVAVGGPAEDAWVDLTVYADPAAAARARWVER